MQFGQNGRSVNSAGTMFSSSTAPAAILPPDRIEATAEPTTTLWNVAMLVLLALIFTHLARPFEFILVGYKLPLVVSLIGILTILTTRALKGFMSGPGKALIALMVWMAFCCPFSTWKGGSTTYLLYFAALQIAMFLLAASAPRSFRDLAVIAYAVVGAAVMYTWAGGQEVAGRFALSGTFGNSDDVALLTGFAIPFMVLIAQRWSMPAKAFILIFGCGALLRWIGLTGTRAAILGMLGMLAVYLYHARMRQRVLIIVLSVTGFALMLLILPGSILDRFATTFKSFSSESDLRADSDDEAIASTLARRDIWKDAIDATLSHPLFGVGPGEFVDYRWQVVLSGTGGHKQYLPTHNTFLEVSSDEGFPGLFLYLAFLVTVFLSLRASMRLNRPGSHPGAEAGRQLCICLQAAMVYFVVCAFFMTCEKHFQQYLAAGLAIALQRLSALAVARQVALNDAPIARTASLGPAVIAGALPPTQNPGVRPPPGRRSALWRPR